MIPAPKIRIRDVSVSYGKTVVLQDICLDVLTGEVVCLIGASGCGKTTLLNVIAGLLPCRHGRITIDGRPVTGPGPDRVMVFQEDAVFPWMRVRGNVEYGLRIKKIRPTELERRTREVLQLVALQGKEELLPRQLSGGMRKRVDLARALAVDPKLLLMDEPYAALDAMTKERLQVEFLNICEKTSMTVVFVTHDLEEALFLGDRVVLLGRSPGRILSVLEVPFRHPRDSALKRSPQFQDLRGQLASQIQ